MSSKTKRKKSQTETRWTLRGIEQETRTAIEKAAKKEGKAIGQFCNEKLRIAATETLKGGGLPVRQEDLVEMIEKFRADIKSDIEALKPRPNWFQRLRKR